MADFRTFKSATLIQKRNFIFFMSTIKPLARNSEIVIQEMGEEVLIYDLRSDKAFSFNSTTVKIWQLCNGKNSVADIATKLSVEFGELVSEDLVLLALKTLQKENLLEVELTFPQAFENISRREIVRRVGLTSLIALPVISSLVAPLAIHAQSNCSAGSSGRALGCPCTAISQCQPPSGRCCLSSTGAPGNQTCVVAGTQISVGGICGNSCSCTSNCCSGGLCTAAGSVGLGAPCTVNCACGSNACSGGICVA